MPHEIVVYGVLIPGLLPIFLAALVVMAVIDTALARRGLYRKVWHPSLLRLALFTCLFCAGGLLLIR
ncbi:DUF1656 domain-containing protein [Aerosticca soli]|uniref:Na+-dependent transporters of the SNF family n=1 Tax=Aerosticca soli TaxID=2010829 RepID=A0A2Z6E7M9_9GAMM|nr:DUF1656 domain-containing protein [Aerosticca soli]BBD81155.1 Na+-dependent transporters of the SNF family [Aerosticca soli]